MKKVFAFLVVLFVLATSGVAGAEVTDGLPAQRESLSVLMPSKLYPSLDVLGFDLEEFKAGFPTTNGLKVENGFPVLPDNGYDSVKIDLQQWYLTENMTLVDGVWRYEGDKYTAEDFAQWLYTEISVGDWKYTFDGTKMTIAKYKDYFHYFAEEDSVTVWYTTDTMTVAAQYWGEGLTLTSYSMQPSDRERFSIDMGPDNTIQEVTVDYDYHWQPEAGWSCWDYDNGGYKPCDAPDGYENINAEELLAQYPPQLVLNGEVPGEEFDKDFGLEEHINLKSDALYYNLADQGVDLEGCKSIPLPEIVFRNDLPAVKDRGYDEVSINGSFASYPATLKNGYWVIDDQDADAEFLSEWYVIYIRIQNDSIEILNGETVRYFSIARDGWEVNYLEFMDYLQIRTMINGRKVDLMYDITNGNVLMDYEILSFPIVKYDIANEVIEFSYYDSAAGVQYRWTPNMGWAMLQSGEYVACDAPDGYEGFDSDTLKEQNPPMEIVGVVLPEVDTNVPAARPAPTFRKPKKLYLTLDKIGVVDAEFTTDLPSTSGLKWENGLPVVPDHGYDKVAIADGYWGEFKDAELVDGAWTPREGDHDVSYFYYGAMVRITIGDWMYNFNEDGKLTNVTGGDYARRVLSSGRYTLYYQTGTMLVEAPYDQNGNLRYYNVNLNEYPDLFIEVGTDNQVVNVEMYNSDGTYTWTADKGWILNSWGASSGPQPCDPPAGCEMVSAEWLAANIPPQVVTGDEEELEAPESYVTKLPADLTAIEAEAFQGAQFTDCYLPDGVTDIGAAAFRNCAELVYVRIPATVTTIAADAFEGCAKLVIVAPEGSQAEVYATAGGIRFIAE